MVNITIQNLEVESTALNQVSAGEMEKVIGGATFNYNQFTRAILAYIATSGFIALVSELF